MIIKCPCPFGCGFRIEYSNNSESELNKAYEKVEFHFIYHCSKRIKYKNLSAFNICIQDKLQIIFQNNLQQHIENCNFCKKKSIQKEKKQTNLDILQLTDNKNDIIINNDDTILNQTVMNETLVNSSLVEDSFCELPKQKNKTNKRNVFDDSMFIK